MTTVPHQPDSSLTGSADPLDNLAENPSQRAPLVLGDNTHETVTDKVAGLIYRPTPKAWYVAFFISVSTLGVLGIMLAYLLMTGVGVWGNNNAVAWGWPITNFVFWVGIGHAGTLISAILFLFRQNWRTSVNRFAEAMTIFAVMCAGLFPAVHVGRAWLAYWLAPYPNQMAMWPQFRSPLLWDVFAVSTYATVSLLFWYVGMVPDFATLRDRAKSRIAQIGYGIASLGWTGSSMQWHRFEKAYLLLAALATPLVLSVHSVVSFDFAVSQLPGWHTTIFPPYFVAGAIFSGFAMVLTLAIPARELFGLKDLITKRHLDNMARIMLATGLIVGYAYTIELFIAWYSGSAFEWFAFLNRMRGNYAWAYWTMVTCNVIIPQLLWIRRIRVNPWTLFSICIVVNIGMWFERYVIILTSLSRSQLPSSWQEFWPTWVDVLTFVGSFGLFFTMFLLFIRFLPMVAMAEIKAIMPQAHSHEHGHDEHHDEPSHKDQDADQAEDPTPGK